MVEFINDKVYRVKNFAKHQNIKVKEKTEVENKQTEVVNEQCKENYVNYTEKSEEAPSDIQHNNSPVVLELKKPQKTNKKNKKGSKRKITSDIIESNEDGFMDNIDNTENIDNIGLEEEDICMWSTEDELSLREGERLLAEWRCWLTIDY